MIDIKHEKLLTLTQAAKNPLLKQGDRPASLNAIWRWRSAGVLSLKGTRVHLEAVRLPGGVYTSEEAIERFVHALNDAPLPPAAIAERSDQVSTDEREMAAAGLM